MVKIEIIDGWRSALGLNSVRIPLILAAIAAVEAQWSVLSKFIPESWKPWFIVIFALAAVVGALIKQPETVIAGQVKKLDAISKKVYELRDQYNEAIAKMLPDAAQILTALNAAKKEYDRLYVLIESRAQAEGVQTAAQKAKLSA